jgi:hypothetical protein
MESILTERMVKRTQAISELHRERNGRFWLLLRQLVEIEITEVREDNDTADPDRVKLNQGKIEAYKHLLESVERGVIVDTRA